MRGDLQIDRVLRNAARRQSGRLYGPQEGRIESVDDPARLGRVQIRIWVLHGGPNDTSPAALPWCQVVLPGGAGYDHGPSHEYIVGQDVWIECRDGDMRYPIVLGSMHGAAGEEIEMLTRSGTPAAEQTWKAPKGSTVPKDVFDGKAADDKHPTRKVWKKSYKGHTIVVEDKDGAEFLRIIDRAGQMIEMSCPVTVEANKNNAQQRGVRDTVKGDQVGHDKLVEGRAFIRLKDISGQEVVLDGREGNESVTLTSQCRNGHRQQTITMSSKQGDDAITIQDVVGNTVELAAWRDDSIKVQSQSGSALTMSRGGNVTLSVAGDFALDVDGKITGTHKRAETQEYQGSLKETVLATRTMNVGGSLIQAIGAAASTVVAGAYRMVVGNLSLDGTVADAWYVQLLSGNALLKTMAGAVTLANLLSKVEVDVLGNITLQTPAGSVQITTTGQVILNSGTVPCNNLPFCLFTGAVHGTNPNTLA
ncbi:MAG: hypothetical protein A2Y38_04555 [Spirochaetes bacterium GWB1_59_5]|nr:MAG: hypothetical protein A2Y38_04555 [Spirochaetes bacterium GWB1_59_5]